LSERGLYSIRVFNQQFSADFVAGAVGKHAIYTPLPAYALP
jgi:hypothetical protein